MKKVSLTEAKHLLESQNTRILKYRYGMVEVPMEDILYMIEPSTEAQKYVDFYNSHPAFATVPAGAKWHHWWKGGLEEHLKEMIGMGLDLLELYPGDLNGKINRSDVIIACFLHDFAKIWAYVPISEEDRQKNPKKYLEKQEFKYSEDAFRILPDEHKTLLELARHGIAPSDKQWSAVIFSEGGYSDANFGYANTRTTAGNHVNTDNALAPFIHMLDMYSSQILGKSLYGMPEKPVEELAAKAE
jgi:hypothetical protein